MSNVVSKRGKIERYLYSVTHEGQCIHAGAIEGVSNVDNCLESLLDWFLMMRSGWFNIAPEQLEEIKGSKEKEDLPLKTDLVARYSVVINNQKVYITFHPFTFGMF